MTSPAQQIYNEIMDTINESEDYAEDIDTITKLVGKLHEIATAKGWVGEESKEIYNKIIALYHAGDEDWEEDLAPIINLVNELRQNASAGEDAMDILENYRRCMDELDADTNIKGVWDGEDYTDEGTIDCIVNYVKHLEKNQSAYLGLLNDKTALIHEVSALTKSNHAQKQEIAKLREEIEDYKTAEQKVDLCCENIKLNEDRLICEATRLENIKLKKRIDNLTWEDDGGQTCCSCMELRSMLEEQEEEVKHLTEWVDEGIKTANAKLKKRFCE